MLQEIFVQVKKQAELDSYMLKSMASSFRGGIPFSFNNQDMADLLDRLRSDHVEHLCEGGE